MKFLLITFIFVNTVLLINGEPRIVGGVPAQSAQFPYQVSLQTKSSFHFCGGSLINARHVVTAAHCMKDKSTSDFVVWAGTTFLNDAAGVRRSVETITVHDEYGVNDAFDSDIAMLRLSDPFDLSEFIKPISLPSFAPKDRAVCEVSGWGKLASNDETGVKHLMYTVIKVFNHRNCKELFGKGEILITDNMICAGAPFKDACQGDSGGPLAINDVNNTLIGIVSFGVDCGNPRYPGVYTDVYKFKDWIEYHSLGQLNSIGNIQICAMIIAVTIYSFFI